MLEQESIKKGIIEELSNGNRNASELKDALQIKSYPELWAAIKHLKDEGKIKHYFAETTPTATLTYQLAVKSKSSPILPWGKRFNS